VIEIVAWHVEAQIVRLCAISRRPPTGTVPSLVGVDAQ
jgi:hypothetical protein